MNRVKWRAGASAVGLVLLSVLVVMYLLHRPPSGHRTSVPVGGTVTSLSGSPVAGAVVHAHMMGAGGDIEPSDQRATTRTNAHGVYRLELEAADYWLEVTHSQFAAG